MLSQLNRHCISGLSVLVLVTTAAPSIALGANAGAAQPQVSDLQPDRVKLKTQTTNLIHQRQYSSGYVDTVEAKIEYPVVQSLSNRPLQAKIQAAIDLKQVYGQSLAEIRAEYAEYNWLREIFYETNYNRNGVLQLTYTIAGVGAYPSQYEKYIAVDLYSGKSIQPQDLFTTENQPKVAAIVDRMMQQAIQKAIAKNSAEFGIDAQEMTDRLADKKFTVENLQSFVIGDKGITFVYDFGFPHVALALEPENKYFVSYAQLQPYLRQQGVGAQLMK